MIDPDAPADRPETDQMKVIHRGMRREFALLPKLVAAVAPGDTARAAQLAAHVWLVLGMLHQHHEAEDELLWPLLHERVPLEADLIATIESQHQAIAEVIRVVERDLPAWARTAGPDVRETLVSQLCQLESGLSAHLLMEESAVLPLIHRYLTVPEWVAPQKHAMSHGPRRVTDKLLLAGVVLEDSTDRERAWFLGEMPAPARVLWRLIGARRYAAHQRAIRI